MSKFNPKNGRDVLSMTVIAAIIQSLFIQLPAFATSTSNNIPAGNGNISAITASVPIQQKSNGTELVIGNGQTESVGSALILDSLVLKNGGVLDFSSVPNTLGKDSLSNFITAENFTLESGGIVKVNLSGVVEQSQNGESSVPLLEQDDGKNFIYFGKGSVSGNPAGLQLLDQEGIPLTIGQLTVNYGENNVASLTYGLGTAPSLTGATARLEADEKGWGLGYQLLEVHINDGQTLELVPGTNTTEDSMVLSALLTSDPETQTALDIRGSVAMNNSKNDFDSEILVGADSSLTVFDGALGGNGEKGLYSKKLTLSSPTSGLILANGKNIVGAMETAEDSQVTLLDGANLIVKGSSSIKGNLFGQNASNITFDGTDSTDAILVTVNSSNPDFGAGVLLKNANLTIGSDKSLGTALVHLDKDSSLNYAGPTWMASNVFSGEGTVAFTSSEPLGEFAFKEGTTNFTGALVLSNALIKLDENHPANGAALSNAELNLSNNAKAFVRGNYTLKTLTTDNAVLDFGLINLVEEDRHGSLTVEQLNATGVSTVHLDGYIGIEKNLDNLLNLDDGRQINLIEAKKVRLNAGEHFPFVIEVPDDHSTQTHVIQEGVQGVFYVNLLEDVKSFKGLFIESTLTKLNVEKGYSVVLEPGVGESGRVFSAGITGQGDIIIEGDIAFNNYRAETEFQGKATVTEGASLSFNVAFGLGKSRYASQLINNGTINILDFQYVNQVISDGTINLVDKPMYKPTCLTFVHAGKDEKSSVISGNLSGKGTVELRKGQLRITSSNPNVQGEFNLAGEDAKIREAELILEQADSLGKMSISLGKGDKLTLVSLGEDGQVVFENELRSRVGNSLVTLKNSDVLLTSGQAFAGTYVLENSKLSFSDIKDFANQYGSVDSQDRITTAQMDGSSELNLSYNQAWELQSEVFGSGKLILAAGDRKNTVGFTDAIAASMSENFYGTVELKNASVTLNPTIKTSLTKASLSIGEGSIVEVDSLSNQPNNRIGGLSFNGGKLNAKSVTLTLGGQAPENLVNVSGEKGSGETAGSHVLNLRGSGLIEISVSDGSLGSAEKSYEAVNHLPLLAQDDGTLLFENKEGVLHTKIIGLYNEDDWKIKSTAENAVDRNALKTAFFDAQGKLISITQDKTATLYEGENSTGSQVGTAYYNFTLSSVNSAQAQTYNNKYEAGLYASYGLTQVHINEGKDLILSPSEKILGGDTLSAKIADAVENKAGSVVIAQGMGSGRVVKLTNSGNSYTGTTTVESSMTLVGATDNAVGNTSALILKKDTGYVQVKDSTQTIGRLIQEEAKSSVLLESGSRLSLREGGISKGDNALSGTGGITVIGSTFDVFGSNPSLQSDVDVLGRASVNVHKADALGSSTVHLLEQSSQLSFHNINGRPVVNNGFKGVGIVSLKNSDVEFAGILDKFNGTIDISDNHSTLYTKTLFSLGSSKIKNSGTLILDLDKDGKWSRSLGRSFNVRTVEGPGEVIKKGSGVLTLDDNYRLTGVTRVRAGGVNVGTKNAPMNAVGSFDVEKEGSLSGFGSVMNLTNSGTVFLNERKTRKASANIFTVNENYVGQGGVLVFNVELSSDNDSKQDQLRIKGNATGTSLIRVNNLGGEGAPAEKGITLITIEGNSDALFALERPVSAGAYNYELFSSEGLKNWYLSTKNKIVRSEAGSYISAILSSAQMNMRLHDRLGHSVVDAPTGELPSSAGWVRQMGTHSHFKSGGNTTHMNTSVTQLGADLVRSKLWNGLNFNGGFFGGGLYGKSKTRSMELSKNKTDGFAFGLYGTIYSGTSVDEGFYADTWLQYGRYSNQIYGGSNDFEYRSHGFTFSLETGLTIPVADIGVEGKTQFSLQPQVQIIVNGLKVNEARDGGGTPYKQLGRNNVSLRVGSRFMLRQESGLTAFAETNWIHNSKKAGVQMEADKVFMDAGKNIGELKIGLEARLSKNLNGWISASVQGGAGGYHNESAQVGLKYRF